MAARRDVYDDLREELDEQEDAERASSKRTSRKRRHGSHKKLAAASDSLVFDLQQLLSNQRIRPIAEHVERLRARYRRRRRRLAAIVAAAGGADAQRGKKAVDEVLAVSSGLRPAVTSAPTTGAAGGSSVSNSDGVTSSALAVSPGEGQQASGATPADVNIADTSVTVSSASSAAADGDAVPLANSSPGGGEVRNKQRERPWRYLTIRDDRERFTRHLFTSIDSGALYDLMPGPLKVRILTDVLYFYTNSRRCSFTNWRYFYSYSSYGTDYA